MRKTTADNAPSVKYVVINHHPFIRKLTCTKETARFVWLDNYYGRGSNLQIAKVPNVFNSWAEAHLELTRRADEKLSLARRQLQVAQGFVGNVSGMKEPTSEDATNAS